MEWLHDSLNQFLFARDHHVGGHLKQFKALRTKLKSHDPSNFSDSQSIYHLDPDYFFLQHWQQKIMDIVSEKQLSKQDLANAIAQLKDTAQMRKDKMNYAMALTIGGLGLLAAVAEWLFIIAFVVILFSDKIDTAWA